MTEQNQTIAVDGASGYVGSHLVHALCKSGIRVRAIVHPKANLSDCQFLSECGAEIYKTDIDSNSETLKKALTGANTVVHLIGSIAPKKGQKLEELHAGITQQLVNAAKDSNAKILMITALGTSADAISQYHKTKWEAEEIVRKSGLPYTILRPSLILGRQVGRRDSKLMARYIELIKTRPKVPLLGGGKNLLQPVFIGDLSNAISKVALSPDMTGKTLEIGGAEVLSMQELVSKLMDAIGKRKPLQPVPPALANILASVLELVQSVPMVSKDQVKLSTTDNICRDNALENQLALTPTPLAKALATYR